MAGSRIVEAVTPLLSTLEELGIRYFAGGSVASSIHGIARYTQDVDIVADVKAGQAETLAAKLSVNFYADAGQIRDAIEHDRAFNLIHFSSGFKIDIFPLGEDMFHERELERSERKIWNADVEHTLEIRVASAEDTVLAKLRWYERGGQISDRQWTDVLGIAASRTLDREYLRSWGPALGVADLLEKLLSEAQQI
jgi:hypothetical protein